MPSPRSVYQAAVLEARRRGFRLTRQTELLVQQAFREAAASIEFDLGTTETLTDLRASFLRQQILGILDELELRAARTTQSGVSTTIREVTQIHEQVVRKLLAQEGVPAGLGANAGLARLNTRVALTLAARRPAADMRTLVNRHIEEAAPALDRLLVSGVARGVSGRTLTADVADLLATAEGASLATYELDESAVTGLRTLWADAQRISRSEVLNAYRESNAQAMNDSPIVAGMKWQTSGNHPLEDECLRPDAKIVTAGGLRDIADVCVGDMVLTHRGRWRPVVATRSQPCGNDGLLRVLCQEGTSHTYSVDATPNHPALTAEGWMAVGDLRTGMRVRCLPEWRSESWHLLSGDNGYTVQQGSAGSVPSGHRGNGGGLQYGASQSFPIPRRMSRNDVEGSAVPTERRHCVGDQGGVSTRLASWDCQHHAEHKRSVRESLAASSIGLSPCIDVSRIGPCYDGQWEKPFHNERNLSYVLVLPLPVHASKHTDRPESRTWRAGIGRLFDRRRLAWRTEGTTSRHSRCGGLYQNTDGYSTAGTSTFRGSRGALPPDSTSRSGSDHYTIGSWAYIKDIMVAPNVPTVYNLQVAEDESFIADGVVVHNCDVLEQTDFFGMGEGVYPPDAWPLAPHPQCACSAGETILRPVDEWDTPKDPAGAPDFEDLDVEREGWSPVRVTRAEETIRASLSDPIGRSARRVA